MVDVNVNAILSFDLCKPSCFLIYHCLEWNMGEDVSTVVMKLPGKTLMIEKYTNLKLHISECVQLCWCGHLWCSHLLLALLS